MYEKLKTKKKKNESKNITKGRTVRTRDEFFQGQGNYRKPNYEDKKLYRKAVVVDSNELDELALVKLYGKDGKKKGIGLPKYQKGKSLFRPFVEILDNDNRPIKISEKFEEQSPGEDIDKKSLSKIRNYLFKKSSKKLISENSSQISKLKSRHK